MKNISYRCVSVILVCVGAFLLAINQLAFAIMCINGSMYQRFIPMSGDFDILPVKIGIWLIGLSAIIFILDLLTSMINRKDKT